MALHKTNPNTEVLDAFAAEVVRRAIDWERERAGVRTYGSADAAKALADAVSNYREALLRESLNPAPPLPMNVTMEPEDALATRHS